MNIRGKSRIGVLVVDILTLMTFYSISATEKVSIRAVKSFDNSKPVTVTISQDGHDPSSATFTKNTDQLKESEQLYYYPGTSATRIKATIGENTAADISRTANDLAGKEIHIDRAKGIIGFAVTLKPKKQVVGPKKQKIRAYKLTDRNADYTVNIHTINDKNERGRLLSSSTFKENTDYKIKKLFLQLNAEKVSPPDPRAIYNANIIDVFDLKKPGILFTATLNAQPIKPEYQLQIDENGISLVDSKNKYAKIALQ